VVAVGARVNNVGEGDRVVVECIQGCGECEACIQNNWIGCVDRKEVGVIRRDGGYAEFMVTPARFVHRIPSSLGLREATLCEPTAVVLKAIGRLRRIWGDASQPQLCAVVGGGPIGHLAARILSFEGHRVTVFDRDQRRLAWFTGSNIQTETDLRAIAKFPAIVEATGDPNALETVLHSSAPGATVLLLGLPYARREFSFETIVGYDKSVIGSVGSGKADFEAAIAILPRLDTTAFFHHVLPIEEFDNAWMAARSHDYLKVILKVDNEAPV
jgi:threonine dehydrogenase-like Zn-dependent dehydrogenase